VSDAVLEITGLTISYGQVRAVSDIHLSVLSGRITTLIGSNGAGKTTIMKGVTGLKQVPPHEGKQCAMLKIEPKPMRVAPAALERTVVALSSPVVRLAASIADEQALELVRAGVRGPAQDVGVAVGPLQERGEALCPDVRAGRDRVGPEDIEQGGCLAACGRADVAPLSVGHHRQASGGSPVSHCSSSFIG